MGVPREFRDVQYDLLSIFDLDAGGIAVRIQGGLHHLEGAFDNG